MKSFIAVAACVFMSSSAFADCVDPAYQEGPGSRMASAVLLPFAAAVTVLTLPVGVIGAATRNETLAGSTSDNACFTADLAEHTLVGNR
jgi:hypothetical protein